MSRHLGVLLIVVLAGTALLLATGGDAGGQGIDTLYLLQAARIGGPSNAVAVSGGRLLLAEGEHVLVVDIAEPGEPRITGQVRGPGGDINDIAVDRNAAYVAGAGGLAVLDITDATAPRVMTTTALGAVHALALEDARLYVAATAKCEPYRPECERLHVLDVTDPSTPRQLGLMESVTVRNRIAVADNVVWAAQSTAGVVAIDASDPRDMREVARVGTEAGFRSAGCVDVDPERRHLYVSASGLSDQSHLGVVAVLDVADTSAPRALGTSSRRDIETLDCRLREGEFYVAQGDGGVEVHTTAGTRAPFRRRQIQTRSDAVAVDAANGLTYFAVNRRYERDAPRPGDMLGLYVYREATRLGMLPTLHVATGVAVHGDVAYVAAGTSGFRTYDVSDPFRPRMLDSAVREDSVANMVTVDGDVALVADGPGGVRLYDVTNPGNLRLLGAYDPGADARRIAARGGVGIVPAAADGGYNVFDFHDPTAPRQVSQIPEPYAADVTFAGELALVAGHGYYDMSDPSEPAQVGAQPPTGNFSGWSTFVATGDRGLALVVQQVPGWMFVPTPPPTPEGPPTPGPSPTRTPAATSPPDGGQLAAIDGSDPSAPRLLAAVPDPAPFNVVAYHRHRAYVGVGQLWMSASWRVYNLVDRAAPRRTRNVGGIGHDVRMMGAASAGEFFLVAAGDQGVYVLRPLEADEPTPTSTPTALGTPSATPTFATWTAEPDPGSPTATATSTARGPGTLPPPYYTMTADAAATPTATSTARGPGTLPPPFYTMTADAAATITADTAATMTADAPDVPINWQLWVPAAEAGH